jgi:ABC-type glutathione transport system ATPase component
MKVLYQNFEEHLRRTPLDFKRYLYSIVNWNSRMFGIVGQRGVGKTTLVHLDIDDINKLVTVFSSKTIKDVWKTCLCTQEPYYHGLNEMLAYLYFDIKNPERYIKESGNVETVCSFTYATPEWKFIYI